jgi:hypothetical protein
LSRTQASFAGDQLKMLSLRANDQRLDDALFPDGISQFLKTFGGKILARLKRTRADVVQRNTAHLVADVRQRCGRWCRGRGRSGWSDGSGGRWFGNDRSATQ